jgi:hypothetical protein
MWLVWNHIFILYDDQTHTSETQYKTQNNYFSADFCDDLSLDRPDP